MKKGEQQYVVVYLIVLFFELFILGFVATADLLDLCDGFEFLLDVQGLCLQLLLQTVPFSGDLPKAFLQVLQLALSCGV